jgi:DNA-binding MarR family transcriptional regulator
MERQDERDEGEAALLGALLRIPYSAIGEAVERGLHAAGYPDLGRAHLTVVQPLFARPEGARLTDLAAWAHVTKPSMTYLVNYLVASGYVERAADPDDGRAQRVRLTARGLAATRTVRALVRETEAAWAGLIGPGHLEQLRLLLRELAVALRGDEARIL